MKALIILFITGVIALFVGQGTGRRLPVLAITSLGLLAALGIIFYDWFIISPDSQILFNVPGILSFDHYALAFSAVAIAAALPVALMANLGFQGPQENYGDFNALILFSVCGAFCMFAFDNMIMLFLGIEILSIPLYVLAGTNKDNLGSNEAALKYFLMGAFATGILLFGITLIYGATASFSLAQISEAIAGKGSELPGFFYVGVTLVMIGLCFKIAAVPFHFWGPDVYEGSPHLVTVFMATVAKTAGIAAFFRLFAGGLGDVASFWAPTLAVIAFLTMTVGNITAIYQSGFKRMMGFSSVAHAGYLLLGIVSGPGQSGGALLLYTLAYALASICAFAIFILVSREAGSDRFEAFRHLGQRQPLLAWAMLLAMLSLAGIPPTAGFFGKYFIFAQAFKTYPWLVIAAAINSIISVFFYFKVVIEMYFVDRNKDSGESKMLIPISYQLVIAAGVILILAIGFAPGTVMKLVPAAFNF